MFGLFKKKQEEPSSLFSQKWIDEWKDAINSSDEYKIEGAGWNAPLILKFTGSREFLSKPDAIGFYLDLKAGVCDELRYATAEDEQNADAILSASTETWVKMIESGKDPMMMLMKGKLKLEKGSMVLLSTQSKAAKMLLKTAPAAEKIPVPETIKNSGNTNGSRYTKHTSFVSTSRGIDFDSFPMKLFQKAKVYGIWNPADISFEKDREDWQKLADEEQKIIIHLSSLFMAGEEAVTLDLLPLIRVIANEKRIEEEIFLTSFLWEEAKHTEFFSRFVNEVMDHKPDFESFHEHFYKILFYQKLPSALQALDHDSSPSAQLTASGTYNMIVEGTLAETGYEAYYRMLNENNILPGMQEGITKLKQDESRHIAYGIYLINRLLSDNPDLKEHFENELEVLLTDATNIIHEMFEPYDVVPFGLKKEWFLDYAIKQFQNRLEKLNLRV
jgi:ribonucleotide reductase beta subunit family protein with ferritin-like domain/putative sterol carrier protein